ncbi:MAG: hypothetical protein K0U93_26440 [Gammaproteobacteria bacterium]|nr:hypothetical protein [Gammaproteobacteria bacterium]
MSTALQTNGHKCDEGELLKQAVNLLSQQLWCWGRDILRPEGNWLLDVGFDRIVPPADRKACPSVYALAMPRRRCVVLRGFGVFYGDGQRGGVFLPHYEFEPRYTIQATLDCPPWSRADLPKLNTPIASQQKACAALTLDLIDWIERYEVNIVEQLGIEYRRSTLLKWGDGTRPSVPAERMASAWRELSYRVASDFNAFLGVSQT